MCAVAARSRTRDRISALRRVVFGVVSVSLLAQSSGAEPLVEPREIEERVRHVYFEGYPFTQDVLAPASVTRLAEMLGSEEDREYRANVVLALGMSRNPAAFAVLADLSARPLVGELTVADYQTRMALPLALGHLARTDARAVGLLVHLANERGDPGWSFGALRGSELAGLTVRRAITGLAVSGRPEVRGIIERAAQDPDARGDPGELKRHVQASLALHTRVRNQGPAAEFGGASHPSGRGAGP